MAAGVSRVEGSGGGAAMTLVPEQNYVAVQKSLCNVLSDAAKLGATAYVARDSLTSLASTTISAKATVLLIKGYRRWNKTSDFDEEMRGKLSLKTTKIITTLLRGTMSGTDKEREQCLTIANRVHYILTEVMHQNELMRDIVSREVPGKLETMPLGLIIQRFVLQKEEVAKKNIGETWWRGMPSKDEIAEKAREISKKFEEQREIFMAGIEC